MSQQDLSELSRERLWGEWEKIALHSRKPSMAFLALEDADLLGFFPELDALRDVMQDPEWHPEGDVYVHTAMVMDAAVALRNGQRDHDLALMFGALCHDLGKPPTTAFIDGRWRSRAHDQEGVRPTQQLLQRIQCPQRVCKQVEILVAEHLRPIALQKGGAGAAAYRRLAR
jgi:tRNA nucleotidyltransferase (CCA-adding enzyme)